MYLLWWTWSVYLSFLALVSAEENSTTTLSSLNGSLVESELQNLTDSLDGNKSSLPIEEKAYFLTFEEWKKKKVDEAEVVKSRPEQEQKDAFGGPVGEEMEIEISMFGAPEPKQEDTGKVYKERFNFASFDCAATIVKTNAEAKGANAILNENKDSYLLNECKAKNKYIIIELCEDILVDEVLLGNYEFFSSMFKDVRISVSDRYPTTSWHSLGDFRAENVRKLQPFKVENPLIWAKFLRIEVFSYYGDEFYCPISSVQVHGKTMIEQFKEEEKEEIQPEVVEKEEPKVESKDFYDTPSFNLSINEIFFSLNGSTEDENCKITPYLGLDRFLKEHQQDLCEIDETPSEVKPKTTHTAGAQESIYKNIINRISLLESNATLSLLYIEEQSRILSTAFENLESRQNNRFTTLMDHLNQTILNQIGNFRLLNTELAFNFENLFNYQNNKFQHLLADTDSKFSGFAHSLNFQKKLNYLNLTIIILLLCYIIITRDTYIESDFISTPYSTSSAHHSPSLSPAISVRKRSKFVDRFVFGSRTVSPADYEFEYDSYRDDQAESTEEEQERVHTDQKADQSSVVITDMKLESNNASD
ncbi:hypothetical protein OGAPHI_006141 [Ogataea philodendri]|uniref:SUN-like protein 1 n=1 Tax=Ogataea philodendri TaxID=1378263 RepID=A0A9P8NZA2_9ASCO|nr:uncharacterized protein OGAPHI_006141 [Ogataea philodendri]KAH3661962.1 hypothetical protein OGAPHI_006141 [Ogataea philodendri]